MKEDVIVINREFQILKRTVDGAFKRFERSLGKLTEEHEFRESRRSEVCTKAIARLWKIPKVNVAREQLLNRIVLDILPPTTKSSLRGRAKHRVVCLKAVLQNNRVIMVSDVVQKTEAEFNKMRNFGVSCSRLLKWCLGWNGLALGEVIEDPLVLDQRVEMPLGELLKSDAENSLEQLALKRLTSVGQLGRYQVAKDLFFLNESDLYKILRPGMPCNKAGRECVRTVQAALARIDRSLCPN